MTNYKLARAVRLALLSTAASAIAFTTPVSAQETEEDVERIEVTGSRIKRTDLEGATPVTVITAEDMADAGRFTVADALRNSTANQFGSFNERSGSSAQSQATVSLLGAGDDRTLVLLDGKRLPGSPSLGGTAVNLNQIPMAMVERIEINKDGGSAVYGSDAIAGVINIVLKKDYEGFNVSGEVGRPSREGGDSNQFSIVSGLSNDKGNITFAFEHQDSDPIFDGDRDYTASRAADTNGDGVIQAYSETDGISLFGATIVAPDFSKTYASPLCDDLAANVPGFRGVVAADDDWGPGSEYCMYEYANVSANKAALKRDSVFVNADYEIAEDISVFTRLMVMNNESFGRYAPPAAWWRGMDRNNEHIPQQLRDDFPDAETFDGLFRWYGIGNRDNTVTDVTQDYIVGLTGLAGDSIEWEIYYHYNKADNKSVGTFYQSISGLAYNEQNGIDLGSEEGLANLKATTLQEDKNIFDQWYGGFSFETGELGGGAISHYLGAEYFEIDYSSVVDAQSEAGRVGGSSGNSSGAEREITALFYESVLPVTEQLELNFAIRYDDYSDFGSEVSPKISIQYRPMDELLLRASWGEGFRAPTLEELTQADAFSADDSTDYVFCVANRSEDETVDEAINSCPERQVDTTRQSNEDLGAETSTFINFGIVYEATDDLSLKLDYFNLEVEDLIQFVSTDDLILNEFVYGTEWQDTDYVRLVRGDNGRLIEAFAGNVNGPGFEIEGVDFNLNYSTSTGFGEIGVNWENQYFLKYEEQSFYNGPVQDTAGWGTRPEWKSQLTLTWSMDAHSFSWNVDYTDSTYETERPKIGEGTFELEPEGSLNSFTVHNASYSFDGGKFGQWTLGARNVFDEDPVLDSLGTYPSDHYDLYTAGHVGRTYYLGFNIDL